MDARWPDSRPVFGKPMAPNGARRRPLYETPDARISILARAACPEAGYVDADCSDQIAETLADGAGHTLAPVQDARASEPNPRVRTGDHRRGRDAAAVSSDVLSRRSFRAGRPGHALRGQLDHPPRCARLCVAAPSATHGATLGTGTCPPGRRSPVGYPAGDRRPCRSGGRPVSTRSATWAERLPEGIPRLEAHLVVYVPPACIRLSP